MTDDPQVIEAVRPPELREDPTAHDCPACGAQDTVFTTGATTDAHLGRPAICLWCRSVLVV